MPGKAAATPRNFTVSSCDVHNSVYVHFLKAQSVNSSPISCWSANSRLYSQLVCVLHTHTYVHISVFACMHLDIHVGMHACV